MLPHIWDRQPSQLLLEEGKEVLSSAIALQLFVVDVGGDLPGAALELQHEPGSQRVALAIAGL